ncbi:MAG: hypothetical protein SGARI_003799 [Bacillariaceae sp.]
MNPYVEKRNSSLKKIVLLRQKENESMYAEEREFYDKAIKAEIANLKALNEEEKNGGKTPEEKAAATDDDTPSETFEFLGESYQEKRESVLKSIITLRKQEAEAMNADQRALVQQSLDHEVKRLISLNGEEKEKSQRFSIGAIQEEEEAFEEEEEKKEE